MINLKSMWLTLWYGMCGAGWVEVQKGPAELDHTTPIRQGYVLMLACPIVSLFGLFIFPLVYQGASPT